MNGLPKALAIAAAAAMGPVEALAEEGDTGGGSPGFALPSVEADDTGLLICAATRGAAAPDECLGAMTEACMDENEIGNAVLERLLCIQAEMRTWRDLADRTADRLAERAVAERPEGWGAVMPDPARAMAEAEAAWRSWTLAECAALRALLGQSPERSVAESRCLRDLAARRFGRLMRIEGEVNSE